MIKNKFFYLQNNTEQSINNTKFKNNKSNKSEKLRKIFEHFLFVFNFEGGYTLR